MIAWMDAGAQRMLGLEYAVGGLTLSELIKGQGHMFDSQEQRLTESICTRWVA